MELRDHPVVLASVGMVCDRRLSGTAHLLIYGALMDVEKLSQKPETLWLKQMNYPPDVDDATLSDALVELHNLQVLQLGLFDGTMTWRLDGDLLVRLASAKPKE